MFSFTKETLQLLHNAGWDEHKEYHIASEYFKALEYEGFHISAAVKEFLYHFGGLSIKHPHAKIKEKVDYFHFDVIKAINSGDTSWVLEEYSSRIGKELCIIGEAFRRSLILCMSPDKNVYAGIDDALFFVGNSGESAIEVLCHGDNIKEISKQSREEKFETSSIEFISNIEHLHPKHIDLTESKNIYTSINGKGQYYFQSICDHYRFDNIDLMAA